MAAKCFGIDCRLWQGSGGFVFGGFKVSGSGAPIIFLFVGVILSFSGRSWYHSLNQVDTLQKTVVRTEAEKKEFADAAVGLKTSLDQQIKLNDVLRVRISPAQLQQLERQQPQLFVRREVQLSPKVTEELRWRRIE